jgi:hypothetical protein
MGVGALNKSNAKGGAMQTGTYGTLIRQAYFPWGTFGVLEVGRHKWAIAEPPWLNNEPFKSCIPEGGYECVSHKSPRFGPCFALVGDGVGINQGDAHRYAILIHSANFPDQLQGCLAPGKSLQPIPIGGREWPRSLGVTQSRQAMQEIVSSLPEIWHLEIRSTHARQEIA